MWNATFTWSPTPSVTVAREGYKPAADFDQNLGCTPSSRECIPQPGTTVKVDALPNRPMYRLAYRNYGSHQALAFVHTVDADAPSGNRAGMRWYELRKFTGGNWGIQNQGTFGPADGLYRWMGAGAMDRSGDLAIGYSIGNGTAPNYPSIAYAGRLVTDPPNELSQGEAVLHMGTGSQTGTAFRWGDYSMMTTDPVDDCTFWYTTGVPADDGAEPVADAHRELQVPELRSSASRAGLPVRGDRGHDHGLRVHPAKREHRGGVDGVLEKSGRRCAHGDLGHRRFRLRDDQPGRDLHLHVRHERDLRLPLHAAPTDDGHGHRGRRPTATSAASATAAAEWAPEQRLRERSHPLGTRRNDRRHQHRLRR